MGWGALRDNNGAFILSCSEGLQGLPNPELAEGLAIPCALVADIKHMVEGFLLASFYQVKQALNEAAHVFSKN